MYDTLKANQLNRLREEYQPKSDLEDMLFKGMCAAMDHLLGYVGSAELNVQYGRLTGKASWYGGQITVKVEKI